MAEEHSVFRPAVFRAEFLCWASIHCCHQLLWHWVAVHTGLAVFPPTFSQVLSVEDFTAWKKAPCQKTRTSTDTGVLFKYSLSSGEFLSGNVMSTVMSPYHHYKRSSLCCLFFLLLWWSFLSYNIHTGTSQSWLSWTPQNISHYRQKTTCPVDRVERTEKPFHTHLLTLDTCP